MHPWEDFAETWTHYLHMVDTLDTGAGFGLSVNPRGRRGPAPRGGDRLRPLRPAGPRRAWRGAWLPLTAAVNSLNRSMGQPDLYPFDPSPNVIEKVRFIHELFHPARQPAAESRVRR